MLTRILKNTDNLRIAVIVNDMSEVNVDALQVQGDVTVRQMDAKLVEMSNGCICCTLREDLLIALERLALDKRFDYVVVESSGVLREPSVLGDAGNDRVGSLPPLPTRMPAPGRGASRHRRTAACGGDVYV